MPFTESACTRLENLINRRDDATAKRKEKFEERNGLRAQLDELGDPEKLSGDEQKEYDDLTGQFYRCSRSIDDLQATISWCNQQIGVTIKGARQVGLFEDKAAAEPPEEIFLAKKPKAKGAKTEDQGDDDDDQMGLGDQTQVEVPKHLTASMSELELAKGIENKLAAAGFVMVGDLKKFLDEGGKLEEKGFSGPTESTILRGLDRYLKSAAMPVEAKKK